MTRKWTPLVEVRTARRGQVQHAAGVIVCATSGLAAALASVFGKLALDPDVLVVPEQACKRLGVADVCHDIGVPVVYTLRAGALGMMILSNIFMTTSFTRAMHVTSSLTAAVATTSFNFSFTAMMSMIVFGEALPALWWAGFTCILIGVALLTAGTHCAEVTDSDRGGSGTKHRRVLDQKARAKSPARGLR